MEYTIKNEALSVTVNSRGAELWHICTADGHEYLWQGDEKYWGDRALNLFPYIARLTEGKYRLEGKTYEMTIHGFVNSSELKVEEHTANKIVFRLDSDETTKAIYPYDFTYRVVYLLDKNRLQVRFEVENKDSRKMYFGIGGHPGFLVPMEEGLTFEDYYLQFSGEGAHKTPVRVGISETCFVDGNDKPYPLEEGAKISLKHNLFDQDAIVLTEMAKEVTIKSDKGSRAVKVTYPKMKNLGIWHMPHTDAPYVCIEPWSSLPSRQDIIEDLATQPGLEQLEAGASYENTWTIEIF